MLLSKMKVFASHVFFLFILSTFILLSGCQALRKAQIIRQQKIQKQMLQITALGELSWAGNFPEFLELGKFPQNFP